MTVRTLVIWVGVVAVVVGLSLAMHGQGHRMLARWMPSIHGGR